jgi:hypothetical protein
MERIANLVKRSRQTARSNQRLQSRGSGQWWRWILERIANLVKRSRLAREDRFLRTERGGYHHRILFFLLPPLRLLLKLVVLADRRDAPFPLEGQAPGGLVRVAMQDIGGTSISAPQSRGPFPVVEQPSLGQPRFERRLVGCSATVSTAM